MFVRHYRSPVRIGLIVLLLGVIGVAAYRIGLYGVGVYHRRAFEEAAAERDFARAERELARCLWVWPNQAELHLLAARTLRRQRNVAGAVERLRHCQGDRSVQEAVALERCLLRIQEGDFANSAQLDRFCDAQSDSPEAMLIEEAQIMGSLAALDVPRARSYLETWNKRRPALADQVQRLVWQATACQLANDVERAAELFDEVLRRDPDNYEARLSLAQTLVDADPQQALQHLQQLDSSHAMDREVLYHQAIAARNLGELDAAALALDQLLATAPKDIDALVARGRIALDQRQVEAAGRWLRQAEALEPKHRSVLLAMIDYSRLSGQTEAAARYQLRMKEVEAEAIRQLNTMLEPARRSAVGPVESPAMLRPSSR
jgi:tetratricopeptide (TPR) repeat protein